MGQGSRRALAILGLMVLLLASGAVPGVVAGLVAALAVIMTGALKIERACRAVNWNVLIMVASLIPLSTAMYTAGAAHLIAVGLMAMVGPASPYALLAGLFVLPAGLGQFISSTATALIIIPVAVAVAVAAAASFLAPIASSTSLMVQGPGGYRFGDYWRLGLPMLGWSFLVAVFLVSLLWPFAVAR